MVNFNRIQRIFGEDVAHLGKVYNQSQRTQVDLDKKTICAAVRAFSVLAMGVNAIAGVLSLRKFVLEGRTFPVISAIVGFVLWHDIFQIFRNLDKKLEDTAWNACGVGFAKVRSFFGNKSAEVERYLDNTLMRPLWIASHEFASNLK